MEDYGKFAYLKDPKTLQDHMMRVLEYRALSSAVVQLQTAISRSPYDWLDVVARLSLSDEHRHMLTLTHEFDVSWRDQARHQMEYLKAEETKALGHLIRLHPLRLFYQDRYGELAGMLPGYSDLTELWHTERFPVYMECEESDDSVVTSDSKIGSVPPRKQDTVFHTHSSSRLELQNVVWVGGRQRQLFDRVVLAMGYSKSFDTLAYRLDIEHDVPHPLLPNQDEKE